MSQSFEQHVVLITGGSTGIGAAVAAQLATAGAKVLITGRHESTLRESSARHRDIAYLVADVSEPADAVRSIEEVKARFGRLDVLINNAAILEIAPLSDAGVEHVRKTFAINVCGLIETTRLALPLLKQSRGTIVNVATVVADQPMANMSATAGNKARCSRSRVRGRRSSRQTVSA